jgi:argonaute-like protein implicated in RNA metabolism and viral defense
MGSGYVSRAKTVAAALKEAEKDGAQAVILFSAPGSESWYYQAKSRCLNQKAPGLSHLASQWVNISRSDHQKPALMNMALQLVAKLGHTPYILDDGARGQVSGGLEPILCGVDVCHLFDPSRRQMTHVCAGLQLRRTTGEVERGWICQGKIKGESIPEHIWSTVVSKDVCADREVVIHRDGRFTDEEKKFLHRHARDIGARSAFGLVEVVKYAGGTPRLYAGNGNAPRGGFLRLSDTEGILATSSCRARGTRNPLLIRVVNTPSLTIERAAEEVFRMSMLSYANLWHTPRLPMTTRAADAAAYFHASTGAGLSRNSSGEGNSMQNVGKQQYWL